MIMGNRVTRNDYHSGYYIEDNFTHSYNYDPYVRRYFYLDGIGPIKDSVSFMYESFISIGMDDCLER